MHTKKDIEQLAEKFVFCRKTLTALGDPSRQYIILEMMQMNDCNGSGVIEITKKTNLSRPVVSNHLQILKDAGIVKMRKEGTMNYYYLDPDMKCFNCLIELLQNSIQICKELPDRSGEEF